MACRSLSPYETVADPAAFMSTLLAVVKYVLWAEEAPTPTQINACIKAGGAFVRTYHGTFLSHYINLPQPDVRKFACVSKALTQLKQNVAQIRSVSFADGP